MNLFLQTKPVTNITTGRFLQRLWKQARGRCPVSRSGASGMINARTGGPTLKWASTKNNEGKSIFRYRLLRFRQSEAIPSVVWLSTGSYPLPKHVLHRVRSGASSRNLRYSVLSLRSPGSCLSILPRLPVTSASY